MRTLVFSLLLPAAAFSQPIPGRPPLRERAAKGDPSAQYTLGMNYEGGRSGLKKDFTQAAFWYRKSAVQGNPYAEASLGMFYHLGKGVPVDNTQAEMWLIVATNRCIPDVRQTIVEMRDSVAEHLNPDQMAEAQKMAHEWKPLPEH